MNRLPVGRQVAVIAALTEGSSIRSTVRMTGVAKNTITKLLSDLGPACAQHLDRTLRGLACRRVQIDEIWSFCYAKQKNVPEHLKGLWGFGDVWTWVALDADTKLVLAHRVGPRHPVIAYQFMRDVAARLTTRVQLTTDGLVWYLDVVEQAFGSEIDYGMLEKRYGRGPAPDASAAVRYSPATITAATRRVIQGQPDRRYISTSYVERQNLTMRMAMRRFTRLTNGFSKKVQNHAAMVAIFYLHYNFCRIHQTLRVTPAIAAGVTDHVWELNELIGVMGTRQQAA
ncbi:MAG: IS1 family transposase [Acidobacteria bacterium]|nr:IS1 family transposase [Acidobacteriota bacterium]